MARSKNSRPGPAADNEEALRKFVQATTTSYYHPAGTCAIGESERVRRGQ